MATLNEIAVEVVFALPTEQVLFQVRLPLGATVAEAIAASGIAERYAQLNPGNHGPPRVGIFGQRVALDTPLNAGDRVEIYRALTVDPKEARRRRVRIKNSIKSNT